MFAPTVKGDRVNIGLVTSVGPPERLPGGAKPGDDDGWTLPVITGGTRASIGPFPSALAATVWADFHMPLVSLTVGDPR